MKTAKILFFILLFGCGSANKQTSSVQVQQDVVSNEVAPGDNSTSLADYLKRIPGVQIQGRGPDVQVLIRGNNTFSENREPLFIINGLRVGTTYQSASQLVDVADIANVRVLKSGSETARYGMQGNNGVIIITTKKKS
ncbi:TonB-dependent receptor plug domain-containing protein [Fulvivirga lutimaris]|uniref:TonB-dependent receptor plug domain-containing protein n=1 Tax=Fulvivirga lutimaris TaxID=1819566 RepID=UPI0012BC87C1|nr:TonB-dependent receptor plug domain-containing protein [Fulvivirga lutimaris]MTI41880.1 hypothetical protein [Fulvivirga lutimaris]